MKCIIVLYINLLLQTADGQESGGHSASPKMWRTLSDSSNKSTVGHISPTSKSFTSQDGGATSPHVYSSEQFSVQHGKVSSNGPNRSSLNYSISDLGIAGYKATPSSTVQEDISSNQSKQTKSVSLAGIEIQECPWWSCQGRCFMEPAKLAPESSLSMINSTNDVPPKCACDNSCLTLGDCCVDFFSYCLNITTETEVVALLKHAQYSSQNLTTKSDIIAWKTTRLLAMYSTCVSTPEGETISMITKCPDGVDDQDVIAKCSQTDPQPGLPPYSYKNNLALTFRTPHCARCHGYQDPELIAWTEGLSCHNDSEWSRAIKDMTSSVAKNFGSDPELAAAIQSGNCLYIYRPPTSDGWSSPRACFPDVIVPATTNGSDDDISGACRFEDLLLCKSYAYQTFAADNTEVKNPHCLKCMTGVTPISVDLPCARGKANSQTKQTGRSPGGILALFPRDSLKDDNTVEVNGKRIVLPDFTCDNNEVFDYVFRVCRTLFCPLGYIPLQGACAPSETVVVPGTTQIFKEGTTQLTFRTILATEAACDEVATVFMKFLAGASSPVVGKDRKMTTATSYEERYFLTRCDAIITPASGGSQMREFRASVRKVYNLTTALNLLEAAFHECALLNLMSSADVANYEQEPELLCPSGSLDVIDAANVTSLGWKLHVSVARDETKALFPLTNVVFRVHLSTREPRSYLAVVCVQSLFNSTLNCSAVPYALNRTQVVNGTLHVVGTDLIFEPEAYELREHFALVCSPFKNLNVSLQNGKKFFEFSFLQVYVSLGCSLCSVLCLLAALLAYALLRELRTLAGRMTASLAGSLVAGQILLLVDFIDFAKDLRACSALGAVCHFCWLAAFSWMSTVAIHMARTFRRTLSTPSGAHAPKHARALFRKYAVICWGLSGMVVVVCYTLDHFPRLGLQVGYGKLGCAWMEKPTVFIVPVGVALLINIICFCVTLFSIERTVRESRLAGSQRRSERTRLLVYAKMSSVMGLTWLFGFAASFSNEVAMWWGYILLNGLQGSFIAFSFFLNRRFFRLLAVKISVPCHASRRSRRYSSKRSHKHDRPNSFSCNDSSLYSTGIHDRLIRVACLQQQQQLTGVQVTCSPRGLSRSGRQPVTPSKMSSSGFVTPNESLASSASITQDTSLDDIRRIEPENDVGEAMNSVF